MALPFSENVPGSQGARMLRQLETVAKKAMARDKRNDGILILFRGK